MRRVRRPLVAVLAMLVLVIVQAVADPTGLLALVGWPGGALRFDLGLWPVASTLVFTPVLLLLVWWTAARTGRFWLMASGMTMAVLLAQAVAVLAMTGDLAVAGRAAAYVTAKAVPAGLIVAALAYWLGGARDRTAPSATAPAARWAVWQAAIYAALAPLLAGWWWTGAPYGPGMPVARPAAGALSVLVAIVLLWGAVVLMLRVVRPRVPGVLGGWIAAMLAGGLVGVAQAVVGAFVDGGFRGDIWPLMLAYVTVADGLASGACLGWILGLVLLAFDRVPVRARRAALISATAVVAIGAVVVPLVLAGTSGSVAEARAAAQAEAEAAGEIPAGFLRAQGERIADGRGNQVLLRGVNVNQLVDFYQHRPDVPKVRPLDDADFAQMASYGFNVVRLGLSWSALEPVQGELDAEYLARIREAVDDAAAHGIYTVLDLHQDGWWKGPTAEGTACRPGTDPMWGFDGAPEWATITDGAPRCQFTGRDISPAGDRAFQHFYFNTDGVRDALARTWGELAGEFADEPMVAGFDLFNEPGFGETAPATTSHLLGAFYDDAIARIREAGAPQIVFIEPSILWSGLGFDVGPQPGFTDDANIAWSPHLYAESITMDRDLGIPAIVSIERQFQLAERAAAEYGVPLWSGEYGYWGDADDVRARMSRYAVAEDERMLGSAYWVWKQACGDPQNGIQDIGDGLMIQDCTVGAPGDDIDGGTKADVLAILARAYPQRAPGALASLAADGPAVAFTGVAPARSCDLIVWVPGPQRPTPEVTAITQVQARAVDGGWIVTGCAEGEYSFVNGAR